MPVVNLLTLQDAKDQLDITSTANDVELQSWIDATTALVELRCGPMSPQSFTQTTAAGRSTAVVLRQYPVKSVDSMVAVLPNGPAYVATDFYVDDAGLLRRLDGRQIVGPLRVTYTAGRDTIPPAVTSAAKVIVQHFWATQRGNAPVSAYPGAGDVEMPAQVPGLYWDDIPNQAKVLLGPYLLGPEVA